MDTAAVMPAPTPEYEALVPEPGEAGLDPLTRIGTGLATEAGGSDDKDPTRDNKNLPKQLGALMTLRAQGFDNTEIAKQLGVKPGALKKLLKQAQKDYGWSNLSQKIAAAAIPRAVDNVIRHLDHEGKPGAVAKGRNRMTREVLKGLGVFKTHAAIKQESKSESINVLRVEIALPEIPNGVSITDGSVIAAPRRAMLPAVIDVEPVK